MESSGGSPIYRHPLYGLQHSYPFLQENLDPLYMIFQKSTPINIGEEGFRTTLYECFGFRSGPNV